VSWGNVASRRKGKNLKGKTTGKKYHSEREESGRFPAVGWGRGKTAVVWKKKGEERMENGKRKDAADGHSGARIENSGKARITAKS